MRKKGGKHNEEERSGRMRRERERGTRRRHAGGEA